VPMHQQPLQRTLGPTGRKRLETEDSVPDLHRAMPQPMMLLHGQAMALLLLCKQSGCSRQFHPASASDAEGASQMLNLAIGYFVPTHSQKIAEILGCKATSKITGFLPNEAADFGSDIAQDPQRKGELGQSGTSKPSQMDAPWPQSVEYQRNSPPLWNSQGCQRHLANVP